MFVGFNECKHWWDSYVQKDEIFLVRVFNSFGLIFSKRNVSITVADPVAGRGGGQETWNLCGHLQWPSFLWLIFTGLGEGMAPCPWIRYCYSLLCTHSFSCLMEQKRITFLPWKNSVVLAWEMRLRMATYPWPMLWMCTLNRTDRCKTWDLESIMKFLLRKISSVSAACLNFKIDLLSACKSSLWTHVFDIY